MINCDAESAKVCSKTPPAGQIKPCRLVSNKSGCKAQTAYAF